MILMNNKMAKILQQSSPPQHHIAHFEVIYEEIIKLFRFYNNGNLTLEKEYFIHKYFGTITKYEVGLNEFIYPYVDIPPEQLLGFVMGLSKKIQASYNAFGVIVTVTDQSHIKIRVHLYREQEGLWLTNNLDTYAKPLLYLQPTN